jgi:hypothetical protein
MCSLISFIPRAEVGEIYLIFEIPLIELSLLFERSLMLPGVHPPNLLFE